MKIEIKSISAKSMFKTTIYLMCIPVGIIFVAGIISLIIGIASGNSSMLYTFLPLIIMPFFMIIIYGLLGMLVSVIYSFFANKFGGLELTVTTNDTEASKVTNIE